MKQADIESRRYTILSESQIETIHEKTLRLLQRVGIVIEHAGALELLESAGARIDKEAHRAWLPSDLVQDAIRRAPSTCLLAGQEPTWDMHLAVMENVHAVDDYGLRTCGDCERQCAARHPGRTLSSGRIAHRLAHIHLINAISPLTSAPSRDDCRHDA
jgi:trimethylamine--corrinoid protein Co-methyltransferase